MKTDNGYIVNPGEVAEEWCNAFRNLLNDNEANALYDGEFYRHIMNEKNRLENEMNDYRQIAAFTTLPRKDRNRSKCSKSTPINPKGSIP